MFKYNEKPISFVNKAIAIHGNKYDYTLVNNLKSHSSRIN